MTQVLSGVVVGVRGATPGPASNIAYDIKVNYPDGRAVTYPNVPPTQPRWPDTIDTVASPVGTPVTVAVAGGKLWFQLIELPKLAECGG